MTSQFKKLGEVSNNASAIADIVKNTFRPGYIVGRKSNDRPTTSGAVHTEGSVRITGQSLAWPKLKAATQIKPSKAVLCVSNVSMNLTVLDMKNHCADLGVHSFFCYDITTSGRSARAFKLAVSNEH